MRMRIIATSIGNNILLRGLIFTIDIILKTLSTSALLIGRDNARMANEAKSPNLLFPLAFRIFQTAIQNFNISTFSSKVGEISCNLSVPNFRHCSSIASLSAVVAIN